MTRYVVPFQDFFSSSKFGRNVSCATVVVTKLGTNDCMDVVKTVTCIHTKN